MNNVLLQKKEADTSALGLWGTWWWSWKLISTNDCTLAALKFFLTHILRSILCILLHLYICRSVRLFHIRKLGEISVKTSPSCTAQLLWKGGQSASVPARLLASSAWSNLGHWSGNVRPHSQSGHSDGLEIPCHLKPSYTCDCCVLC